MSKEQFAEFDAESVEMHDIDGEAEVIINLPESDEPVVLYLDLVDWVKQIARSHPDVSTTEGDQ